VHPSRPVRLAAVVVIGALALTACGSSSKSSSSGKKSYTIGFQMPLSGDNAQLGINMLNGAKLAVEQANAKGDLGFTVKYVTSDDAGDPAQSPAAAQKLIDNKNVIAVLGPGFSGTTNAAEPHYSDAGLASVSGSATRADLTSNGFKTFQRVITGDNIQGVKMADYVAKGLKSKSAYVIDDKSAYGAGLVKFIKNQLTTDGVTVKAEGIAPTKDYSAVATKAKASGADTVVYSGYYAEFALLTKALHTAGYKGNLVSGDGSKDDQYITQGGSATEGAYLTCPCGPTASSPAAQKFAADFKAKYNAEPGTYSAEYFDGVNLIIAAIKAAGANPTRASVEAAVKVTKDFAGVSNPSITFDAKGEGGTGQIFAYQVKGGKITLLGEVVDGVVKK
jgi:branched-chain amino acid transport system substrate-binding protein